MRDRFFDIAFTDSVQAEQRRQGSRDAYAAMLEDHTLAGRIAGLADSEARFLAMRDSFYLATVSQTGWPYVQHRGGPAGFVHVLDARTIGWAEYAGNRQYVSVGNAAADDRVAMIFMDYPERRRLKLFGRLSVLPVAGEEELAGRLAVDKGRARVERLMRVRVEAFDWNCPQHITARFTEAEIARLVEPLQARITELESRLRVYEKPDRD